jgi:peptidoglycan hydrolase-like protein with peptidoglycan-binding domain
MAVGAAASLLMVVGLWQGGVLGALPGSLARRPGPPPPPLMVTSVNPANGAANLAGTAPVTVSFSAPVAARSPMPHFSPAVAGHWRRSGRATYTFTPTGAFLPDTMVTLDVPGGPTGVKAADGARLAAPLRVFFSTGQGSTLRLQQLLSDLGYSPLSFTPTRPAPAPTDTAAQTRAAFQPPPGTFAWIHTGWPSALTQQWQAGAYGPMTKGMVMAFQADHKLQPNGQITAGLWQALFTAWAAHQVNTGGYNYAYVSKASPETLTLWHDGHQVMSTAANTGIASRPTDDGTFPVYERLRSQVMRGTNPDGSSYADPVQYVAYFNGGDAVHYIDRSSFGYPQSLGCVELPLDQAAQAWPYLTYGTLVTVAG